MTAQTLTPQDQLEAACLAVDALNACGLGDMGAHYLVNTPRIVFDELHGASDEQNYASAKSEYTAKHGWAWSKRFATPGGGVLILICFEPPAGWVPPYRSCEDCGAEIYRWSIDDVCPRCTHLRAAEQDEAAKTGEVA